MVAHCRNRAGAGTLALFGETTDSGVLGGISGCRARLASWPAGLPAARGRRVVVGLRRAVKEQMIFAGLAGVGMQLGDFSSAATSMKRAVAYQDKAEADEDAITGSDMGGW
jgi:hypothetical protein